MLLSTVKLSVCSVELDVNIRELALPQKNVSLYWNKQELIQNRLNIVETGLVRISLAH